MTDFWEILGRLIGGPELRAELQANAILRAPVQQVPGGIRASLEKYNTLTGFLDTKLPDLAAKPVSVTAKGEYLRVLPMDAIYPQLDKLEARAKTLGVELTGRSGRFYACVGALTVDDVFAGEVAVDPGTAFGGLTAEEEADVRKLAADNQDEGSYGMEATNICIISWEPDCEVRLRPYADAIDIGKAVLVRGKADGAAA